MHIQRISKAAKKELDKRNISIWKSSYMMWKIYDSDLPLPEGVFIQRYHTLWLKGEVGAYTKIFDGVWRNAVQDVSLVFARDGERYVAILDDMKPMSRISDENFENLAKLLAKKYQIDDIHHLIMLELNETEGGGVECWIRLLIKGMTVANPSLEHRGNQKANRQDTIVPLTEAGLLKRTLIKKAAQPATRTYAFSFGEVGHFVATVANKYNNKGYLDAWKIPYVIDEEGNFVVEFSRKNEEDSGTVYYRDIDPSIIDFSHYGKKVRTTQLINPPNIGFRYVTRTQCVMSCLKEEVSNNGLKRGDEVCAKGGERGEDNMTYKVGGISAPSVPWEKESMHLHGFANSFGAGCEKYEKYVENDLY